VSFARVLCLLLAGAAVTAASSGAHAQVKQPLRILVPLPPGSTSDVVARLIADGLREKPGRPVIVENKPGATGRIAVDAFKTAAPDGATLLFAPIAIPVIGPLVFRNPGYDPAKDFAPVAQVAKYEFALAVAASHPARTAPEFVAWARANPQRASVGNPGAGSLPHFLGVMVAQASGIELVHVAYRGVTVLEAELMSGQIAAGISAISDLIGLHRAGKLRILATAGAERSPLLPEVPTFREQGYPTVEAAGWHGVYAPAGTPKPVVDRLSMAIVKVLRAPELRERLRNLSIEPTGTTPEALAAIMAADTARWAPIIKAAGFAAEPR
jgi:tripartite-type tricarboxylate transporter receptor subunit TctC